LTLKLRGKVDRAWTWSTDTVIFDGIDPNETATRTIELRRNPNAASEAFPQAFTPSKSLFRVNAENGTTTDGRASRRIKISTVPPLAPGRQEAFLYAYSAGSAAPISRVRVILIVVE
jgi:hypothetical protein